MIKEFANQFQYHILPEFMKLKPEDESLANNDPIEQIKNEEEPLMSFTNLKKGATELWTSFAQIGSKTDQKQNLFMPGPYLNENFNYLLSNLNSSNLLDKELGMYLLS